jgi:gamma-D-glutamyl-L-lysine dipeptidyl-peptidase
MSVSTLKSAVDDPVYDLEGAAYCREVARRISLGWNDGAAGLETCLERLRQQMLSDRVAFFCDVRAALQNGQLHLSGAVERPEFRSVTHGVFQALGYTSIVDQIEVLPPTRPGTELFGVATAPHLLTWSRPELTGLPMDEALLGEPVYLLKELPQAWLLKTFTGYWGYARKDQVRCVSRAAFVELINQPRAALVQDVQVGDLRLPAGCRLPIVEWGTGATCRLLEPRGQPVEVPQELCLRNQRDQDIARVVSVARSFLNAPCQMGGKNRVTGIDCSGLVQLSYRAIGVSLPRDAKQQYLGGYLIPPYLREALRPGDAVYFMNAAGQVDHTGLYLGNQEIIHAIEPRVTIQSLDPGSTNYSRRFEHEFLGAKRFWW